MKYSNDDVLSHICKLIHETKTLEVHPCDDYGGWGIADLIGATENKQGEEKECGI